MQEREKPSGLFTKWFLCFAVIRCRKWPWNLWTLLITLKRVVIGFREFPPTDLMQLLQKVETERKKKLKNTWGKMSNRRKPIFETSKFTIHYLFWFFFHFISSVFFLLISVESSWLFLISLLFNDINYYYHNGIVFYNKKKKKNERETKNWESATWIEFERTWWNARRSQRTLYPFYVEIEIPKFKIFFKKFTLNITWLLPN